MIVKRRLPPQQHRWSTGSLLLLLLPAILLLLNIIILALMSQPNTWRRRRSSCRPLLLQPTDSVLCTLCLPLLYNNIVWGPKLATRRDRKLLIMDDIKPLRPTTTTTSIDTGIEGGVWITHIALYLGWEPLFTLFGVHGWHCGRNLRPPAQPFSP